MKLLRRALAASMVVMLLWAVGARADGDLVSVDRTPADCSVKTYDKNNPPPEMPPQEPNQAGVTVSKFECLAHVYGQMTEQKSDSDGVIAGVRIVSVKMNLRLTIVEWLADGTGRKIRAHEDGHRMISEHFYNHADDPADSVAREQVGRTYWGSGPNLKAAVHAALSDAATTIDQHYMDAVREPCDHAQVAYDRITQHGTNTVDEMEAIDRALREVGEEPDR